MQQTLSPIKAFSLLFLSIAVVITGIVIIDAPTSIVLIAAGTLVIIFSLVWGIKWDDIEKDILASLHAMFKPILILLAVGMLIGSWLLSGTIPVLIYYGLMILTPAIFLFAAVFICSLMSIMAGTSWGTIGTVGVALMGISVGLGIPPSYTAGAIVVGAMFGDKLSPLSDTTVMASAVTDVPLVEHIKHMLYTTIPGYIISVILYIILGIQFSGQDINKENIDVIMSTLNEAFNLNLILILPPFIVLFLIFKRKPTLPVFGAGILLGCMLAVLFQGSGALEVANALNGGFTDSTGVKVVDEMLQRGGLNSMLETTALLIAAAFFGAPLRTSGVITVILEKIIEVTEQGKTMMMSSLTVHGLLFMITGSYYVTFAVLGPMLKTLYDQYGLHRKNLSRTMEDTGTTLSPLIPWGVTGAFCASTLQTPVSQYALYAPMTYLAIVFAIIYIFTGYGIAKAPQSGKQNAYKERSSKSM
ncbi:Na+/H+ antiporter NhaC [Virgibacillus phasianinus]|uniref:Na+/H+ antiporter NhaC n=1 Tax=Virgibacillus phasianinus TaxID=2017483 RepID=A0A220U8G2_9BACI|nr:Na+/H+ antiporter NhaC [Virgibacillus phasianinus]ASK64161.1 Na+/H+ antiporter NhaC [Virgibacillus phasianinus]